MANSADTDQVSWIWIYTVENTSWFSQTRVKTATSLPLLQAVADQERVQGVRSNPPHSPTFLNIL